MKETEKTKRALLDAETALSETIKRQMLIELEHQGSHQNRGCNSEGDQRAAHHASPRAAPQPMETEKEGKKPDQAECSAKQVRRRVAVEEPGHGAQEPGRLFFRKSVL